jgi:CRISPR-associated protein Cas1
VNGILNLVCRALSWKVHRALTKAKLEPFLGFLHSIQYGLPSLVCDFQELCRYLVDDIVIEYCKGVKTDDFVLRTEDCSANRKGKRQYLNDEKTNELINGLNRHFERRVRIPRIRRGERGKRWGH